MKDNSFEKTANDIERMKRDLKLMTEGKLKKPVVPKKPIFTDINFKTEYIDELEAQAAELKISVQEFIELAVEFYKKNK